jgi:hypothetical protein
MSFYRLIYKSTAVEPISRRLVDTITTVSQRNNARIGVTGILLATRQQYVQVLEGEIEAVNGVYQKVCCDPRHTGLIIVSYKHVSRRRFPKWSMRGMRSGLTGIFLIERLAEKYGEKNGDVLIPLDESLIINFITDASSYLGLD